jgi:hypothetical protein
MRVISFAIFVTMIAALGFSTSFAQAPAERQAAPQPTIQQIVAQQTQLRADVIAKKGAFKDLTEIERRDLVNRQNRVLKMLDGRNDLEKLRIEEKVEVFNDLQWISAAVRQAEEDRQVCERSRTVGSNRYKVVCMTAKQYREHKDGAQQSLRTPMKCQGADTLGCRNEQGGNVGIGGGNFKLAGAL